MIAKRWNLVPAEAATAAGSGRGVSFSKSSSLEATFMPAMVESARLPYPRPVVGAGIWVLGTGLWKLRSSSLPSHLIVLRRRAGPVGLEPTTPGFGDR